jgi:5-methylcytosine-specific restriction endonuclease McrA
VAGVIISTFNEKEYKRQWRERNREKLRLYFQEYRAAHPELSEYHRQYHQTHRERRVQRDSTPEAVERRRLWRAANRAKRNAWRADWAARNPDAMKVIERRHAEKRKPQKRLSDAEYRARNPELCAAIVERSKAKKPELYRAHAVVSVAKRRARKRSSLVERVSHRRIIERDRGLCHLCLLAVSANERSFDHLIPVCRQGAHAEWNLMLAHLRCNKRRSIKQILTQETKEEALLYIRVRSAEVSIVN